MKTWLITGCSEGGLGAGIARAVLKHGDNVVVTARNLAKVQSVIVGYPETAFAVALDVTRKDSIYAAVRAAKERFGTIDVLVNNAGYCYRSSIEEADDAGVLRMYETNFFGAVHMIQAVLPAMRAQKSGAIVNISSIGAITTAEASGYYASTKAALELMSNGLAAEVNPLGIKVLIVEPGAFRTHFYDTSLKGSDNKIAAYKDTAWTRSVANSVNAHNQIGDPEKAGAVIMKALESDETPLRLLLGSDAVKVAKAAYQARLQEIDKWEDISVQTDY